MSNYLPAPSYEITASDLEDAVNKKRRGFNFLQRCFLLDYNKKCFDYINKKKSDYIILDFADARLPIALFGEKDYVSCGTFFNENRKGLESKFGKPNIYKFDHWDKQQWKECINWFCDEILKSYDIEKIILVEVYTVDEYIDKSEKFCKFPDNRVLLNKKVNEHLKYIFDICCEKLQGCHIIRMPENVFGSAFHKLGLLPLHYHDLYYEYAFKAVQLITCEKPENEEEVLEKLRKEYSDLLKYKRMEIESDYFRSHKATYERLEKYSYCFSTVIKNYDKILADINLYMHENNIKRAAFYGGGLSTDVMTAFLEKCDIKIDYIIDRHSRNSDIPIISPDEKEYPETDLIIVCTVNNIAVGIKKVKSRTDTMVESIYTFLPEK